MIGKEGVYEYCYDVKGPMLSDSMHELKVNVRCALEAKKVACADEQLVVTCADRAGSIHSFKAEVLLVATGGTPNVEELDLDKVGVVYTTKGISINDKYQTSVPNIYTAGDVVGLHILSRVAYYHGKTTVYNMFKSSDIKMKKTDYTDVAKVIFTQLQLASAGLTEQEAYQKYGKNIRIYRCDYNQLERALIDHTIGLIKFVCDNDGVLVGVHALGMGTSEIVDFIQIGTRLSSLSSDEMKKIRTTSSYFDANQHAAYACAYDTAINTVESYIHGKENPILWTRIMGYVFSLCGKSTKCKNRNRV